MKNKIFAYVCAIALVLSLLVIPSFAFEGNDLYGDYTFDYLLNFDNVSIPNGVYVDFYIRFVCDGIEYDHMSIVRNISNNSYSLNYWQDSSNSTLVYDSDSGWESEWYRFIYITEYNDSNSISIIDFLAANQFVPDYSGWYYDIYDTLHTAVFDGNDLTGAQDMVITLLSVLFCCVAIALPVIVVLFFVKYVLSMRFY